MASTTPVIHLYQTLQKVRAKPGGFVAAYVSLSKLQHENKQLHYVKIAATTFDPILNKNETAQVYIMPNKDLVFLGHGVERRPLNDSLEKIKNLFMDDDWIKADRPFLNFFNLENNFIKFHDIIRRIYDAMGGEKGLEETKVKAEPEVFKRICTAQTLASIEAGLLKTDVSAYIRQKPVAVMTSKIIPQPFFFEKAIAFGEMMEALAPNMDFNENIWFREYLRDQMVGKSLNDMKGEDYSEVQDAFSINVPVRVLLSQIFQGFDRSLGYFPRKNVIIEVTPQDIIANTKDYVAIYKILRQKGYNFCITDVPVALLPMLTMRNFPGEFVKIIWDKDSVRAYLEAFALSVQQCTKQFGFLNVILAGCDTKESIVMGQRLGIYLFQGSFVDKSMFVPVSL